MFSLKDQLHRVIVVCIIVAILAMVTKSAFPLWALFILVIFDADRNGITNLACVIAMCAVIAVTIFITKLASPIWALMIVCFFDMKYPKTHSRFAYESGDLKHYLITMAMCADIAIAVTVTHSYGPLWGLLIVCLQFVSM